MAKSIVKKLGELVLVLLIVSFGTFMLATLIPSFLAGLLLIMVAVNQLGLFPRAHLVIRLHGAVTVCSAVEELVVVSAVGESR